MIPSPILVISGASTGGPSSSAAEVTPTNELLAGIWHGTAALAVRQIALIQDGHEDRRPLDSHFGAWVVCTENAPPAGFEPAHTAPEAASLYRADQRKHGGGRTGRARMGRGAAVIRALARCCWRLEPTAHADDR